VSGIPAQVPLSIPGRFLFLVSSSVHDTSTLRYRVPVLVPRYQKRPTPDLLETHVA